MQSMRRVWGHGHTKFARRDVEVASAPPLLYLNFYRKLAMIAKPSIERVADTYRNFYLWLRRAIPDNLLKVIDQYYVRQNKFCMVMSPDPFSA